MQCVWMDAMEAVKSCLFIFFLLGVSCCCIFININIAVFLFCFYFPGPKIDSFYLIAKRK